MDQESEKVIGDMDQQTEEPMSVHNQAVNRYGIPGSEFWVWYGLLTLLGCFTGRECHMGTENEKIVGVMNQQFKELTAVYHNAVSQYGIPDSEFWIWYAVLSAEGERTQQDICDMYALSKQTVNSIVYRMLNKGYIFLKPIPGMRNKKAILPTDSGMEFGGRLYRQIHDAEQRAVSALSPEELKIAAKALEKYIKSMSEELSYDQ